MGRPAGSVVHDLTLRHFKCGALPSADARRWQEAPPIPGPPTSPGLERRECGAEASRRLGPGEILRPTLGISPPPRAHTCCTTESPCHKGSSSESASRPPTRWWAPNLGKPIPRVSAHLWMPAGLPSKHHDFYDSKAAAPQPFRSSPPACAEPCNLREGWPNIRWEPVQPWMLRPLVTATLTTMRTTIGHQRPQSDEIVPCPRRAFATHPHQTGAEACQAHASSPIQARKTTEKVAVKHANRLLAAQTTNRWTRSPTDRRHAQAEQAEARPERD